jgi:hypothetical protein
MNVTSVFKKQASLFALLLLTAALAACGRSPTSQATADNGATTAAAPTTSLTGGDPQSVIANARQLLKGQKSYRVRSTSLTSMGGQPRTGLQEFVAPDRMHNVGDGREIIVIGKTMYVKRGDEWRNMGTQMSDMAEKMKEGVQNMSAEERAQATKGLKADYKSLGDEMLDGTPTAVYEMHSQMDTHVEGVGPITTVMKFWIGKADGLIRKEESDGAEAGMKVKTTRIYEYDPDIKIEAPVS